MNNTFENFAGGKSLSVWHSRSSHLYVFCISFYNKSKYTAIITIVRSLHLSSKPTKSLTFSLFLPCIVAVKRRQMPKGLLAAVLHRPDKFSRDVLRKAIQAQNFLRTRILTKRIATTTSRKTTTLSNKRKKKEGKKKKKKNTCVVCTKLETTECVGNRWSYGGMSRKSIKKKV